jgi:hypothetical protein
MLSCGRPRHALELATSHTRDRDKSKISRPLAQEVTHTRKWIGVLTRDLVNFTVDNAESQRAICLTHKKDWCAELIPARANQANLYCVLKLSVESNALRMRQSVKTFAFDGANSLNRMILLHVANALVAIILGSHHKLMTGSFHVVLRSTSLKCEIRPVVPLKARRSSRKYQCYVLDFGASFATSSESCQMTFVGIVVCDPPSKCSLLYRL